MKIYLIEAGPVLLNGMSAEASAKAKEYLEIIQKNSARMTRLTNDLLTLARVESGEQQLRLESVPASSLLQDAVEDLLAGDPVVAGLVPRVGE